MSVVKDAREGAMFLVSGVVAGLGHYAFQIMASRELSPEEFARFSGWLAHVSLALVVAGLAQFAANFHPLPPRFVKPWVIATNALALLLALAWLPGSQPLGLVTAVAIVGLATLHGFATGQAQIRFDFRALATAQVINAAVKVLIPAAILGGIAGYGLGVGFSYVPALWILSWRVLRSADVPKTFTRANSWTAPVIIAIAANLIPQYDLILMQHTQAPPDFDAFARVSLFYKGIYFFVFIFAQWLLPRQIRGGGPRWLGPGLVAGFAGVSSVGLALVAPLLTTYVFHWSEGPPRALVLLSCLHMSLLTLLFVQIQAACAAGRVRPALFTLAALGVEALIQLSGAWPTLGYLGAAVVAQTMLVIVALRVPAAPVAC